MSKEIFKNEYKTNEEIKKILEDDTLSEEKKRNLLNTISYHNQKIFLEEKKKNQAIKIKADDSYVEPEEKKETNMFETQSENKKMIDVVFYLNQIKECTSIDEILSVLPKNKGYNFENTINTILLYFIEECVEIEQFIASENLTKKDQEGFIKELHEIQKTINAIVDYRNQEHIEEKQEIKNYLVYLTSSSGNVYALSDLKTIDVEYYESFLELIQSIQEGTFKNVKAFNNNNKIGQLYEVKNFKTRIVFAKISKNTFVIISMFMKKSDNDLKYREQIVNRSLKYHYYKEDLKKSCHNPLFIEENEQITKELLEILTKEGVIRK